MRDRLPMEEPHFPSNQSEWPTTSPSGQTFEVHHTRTHVSTTSVLFVSARAWVTFLRRLTCGEAPRSHSHHVTASFMPQWKEPYKCLWGICLPKRSLSDAPSLRKSTVSTLQAQRYRDDTERAGVTSPFDHSSQVHAIRLSNLVYSSD